MKKINVLEKNLNNSSSLITSFTNIFITMLILLGIVTGFSAIKEVKREVYTCLDEKFGMILYSAAGLINEKKDIKSDKVSEIINHYKIGDVGFSAVIDISDKEDKKVLFLSEDAKNTKQQVESAINNDELFDVYIKTSYRPKGFMDLNFKVKQKDFKVAGDYYRMRLCSTNMKDVYVLVAAGHDQFLWKIIRIVLNAITLTLIVTPITIMITKSAFKTLSKQILSLEKAITSLKENTDIRFIDNKLYQSKNEIGHLANSIRRLATELDLKSKTDELTQIYNRRKFNEDMGAYQKYLDKDIPVTILFTDIDYFKRYNDHHGHVAGDVCLKKVAAILSDTFKGDDNKWAYRYGGEEFAMICTNCNKEKGIEVAKKIANNLHEACIPHGDSLVAKQVTLSIGIATGTTENIALDDLLLQSDKAVYYSKENGRNRYTHFSDIITEEK